MNFSYITKILISLFKDILLFVYVVYNFEYISLELEYFALCVFC